MNLKHILLLLPLVAVSCGPVASVVRVEMRQPSKSGLDLSGKTFAVAYLDDGTSVDSTFSASMAEGFAQSLESEYFGGNQAIMIYNIEKAAGADYSQKDSMVNVLMETGPDVLFLFDSPLLGEATISDAQRVQTPVVRDSAYVAEASVPYSVRLYVYDALDKSDQVKIFSGSAVANPVAYTDGSDSEKELIGKALASIGGSANGAGRIAGRPFFPVWSEENIPFVYFEMGPYRWTEALTAAHYYDWNTAIGIWTELTSTSNLQKRSCAAYNLAAAFYILGQYPLAKQWLDVSDKDYPLHLSYDLRKKISSKLR